eukprot:1192686-Prorocentrum_minimum.AAC.3
MSDVRVEPCRTFHKGELWRRVNSHGLMGDSHGRMGDSHGPMGDSCRPMGDSHGRMGDSHGTTGDSHGTTGDSHRTTGDSHGTTGNSHRTTRGSTQDHREFTQDHRGFTQDHRGFTRDRRGFTIPLTSPVAKRASAACSSTLWPMVAAPPLRPEKGMSSGVVASALPARPIAPSDRSKASSEAPQSPVLPLARPMLSAPGRPTHRNQPGSAGGQEGKYRSSVDAREPQNPTKRVRRGSGGEVSVKCSMRYATYPTREPAGHLPLGRYHRWVERHASLRAALSGKARQSRSHSLQPPTLPVESSHSHDSRESAKTLSGLSR